MIGDKQIKDLTAKLKTLEDSILSGSLAHEEYKMKCGARKAYQDAINSIKTIGPDEEDDK